MNDIMLVKYEPQRYWEERLKRDFSLGGAGFRGLGLEYNKWLYKARLRALDKLLWQNGIDPSGKVILDIGTGTGFHIEYWKKRGAASIVGLDITDISVSILRTKYPQYTFVKADISSPHIDLKEKFDVVTAFDILFHIVDEGGFVQAIKNIRRLSHKKPIF